MVYTYLHTINNLLNKEHKINDYYLQSETKLVKEWRKV